MFNLLSGFVYTYVSVSDYVHCVLINTGPIEHYQ